MPFRVSQVALFRHHITACSDPLLCPSNPYRRLCLTSSLLLLPCLHREIKQNWREFMSHNPYNRYRLVGRKVFNLKRITCLFCVIRRVEGNTEPQWLSQAFLKLLPWFYYLSAMGERKSALEGVFIWSTMFVGSARAKWFALLLHPEDRYIFQEGFLLVHLYRTGF